MSRLARGSESESRISAPNAARFRQRLRGDLVLPGDPDYEEARKVWNGAVSRKPAIVAYCAGPDDVVEAVTFARLRDQLVSVRGGGHNVAGCSVCDGGLVIDLSRMKGIAVDPERRTARAQAGLSLGEFDATTQAFGLATTMGVNSDTGMAGLTLGGGFGRLGRKYGLACDNLIAADVVTADGRLLRASAAENADLFWGIRGAGGNFGIVTALEYRLHSVGPTVLGGSLIYDWAQARDALRSYYEFSSSAPDELSADAALVTAPSGERLLSISVCYSGPVDEGERVLEPIRTHATPLEDQLAPISYVKLQSAGDSVFPRGRRYYWKAQFLRELTDAAIDTLLQTYATAPSVMSLAVLQQVGGAIARVPMSETAYGNRDAAYDCFPIAIWEDPANDEANIRWARELWTAMRRFSTGGVYANNLGDEGEDRVRAAYGDNYRRLVALKNKYDRGNFFRMNQNIRPTV
jgi:FAD binding domain/Berberine and berberine like